MFSWWSNITKKKSKKTKQLKYKILGIKSIKLVKGMHFVKVKVGGKKKEFSLFCPTNSIDDITNKKHKINRDIDFEKKLLYADSQMIIDVFQKICKKKISQRKKNIKPKKKSNVRLGKRLYKKCAGCHGATGRGKPLGKRIRLAGQSSR